MDKKREIEKLAYEIFERSGYICGHEFDHWIEAEKIVCSRCEPEAPVKKKTVRKGPKTTVKAAKRAAPTAKKAVAGKSRPVGRPKKSSGEERASL